MYSGNNKKHLRIDRDICDVYIRVVASTQQPRRLDGRAPRRVGLYTIL